MWNRLKNRIGRGRSQGGPRIPVIPPKENEWGVPVLDVRPLTQTALSVSAEMEHARNAISFWDEDGLVFSGMDPECNRSIDVDLHYPTDGVLFDGSLFRPGDMDQRWAVFYHDHKIICVGSWTRKVRIVADVEQQDGEVAIRRIRGVFATLEESEEHTLRLFDYLIRSHCIRILLPVPLTAQLARDRQGAAHWCFAMFGNMAMYATSHPLPHQIPDDPLYSISLLHDAVARQNMDAIRALLDSGVPVDVKGPGASTPLHWVSVQDSREVGELLLGRSADCDIRDDIGETPLMYCAAHQNADLASWFLEKGADVNAVDENGATALHRAAELGNAELAKLLLGAGADRTLRARGQTALSIAEQKGHEGVVRMLGGGRMRRAK